MFWRCHALAGFHFSGVGTSELKYFEQLLCVHTYTKCVADRQIYRINITSILPRQEERDREKQRKANASVPVREGNASKQASAAAQAGASTSEREDAVDA